MKSGGRSEVGLEQGNDRAGGLVQSGVMAERIRQKRIEERQRLILMLMPGFWSIALALACVRVSMFELVWSDEMLVLNFVSY